MNNYKIKLSNEAESKEAQELFFELGFTWAGNSKDILNFDTPEYIVNWSNNHITVGDHSDGNRKEITLSELRAMVHQEQDEPFMTPETTLNDQYAEIEQVRQSMKDNVNNPNHYADSTIECIDAMEAMLTPEQFIGYLRGNVFKYQWRYEKKNGLEDLKKAQWYLEKLTIKVSEKEALF